MDVAVAKEEPCGDQEITVVLAFHSVDCIEEDYEETVVKVGITTEENKVVVN